MSFEVRPTRDLPEFFEAVASIGQYFGWQPTEESDTFHLNMPLDRMHAAFDDGPLSSAELANSVRRWIEGQTFSPRTGAAGVLLLDARAAAYADVDELRLVGLIEGDWPERAGRSIFYPQSLLSQLGWASDQARLAAARAQFFDLLRLPRRRVSLSTFTLEDDAIVSPSPFIEDLSQPNACQF